MFNYQSSGYNTSEVDEYINTLKTDYERKLLDLQLSLLEKEKTILKMREENNNLSRKEKSFNVSLSTALEKAKQIEASSKNIYDLKIQQLNILYSKWSVLLKEMLNKHPELEDTGNIAKLLTEFKSALHQAQKDEIVSNITSPIKTENDSLRLLLGKVTKLAKRTDEPKEVKIERQPLVDLPEKSMIKPITDLKIDNGEGYENLVDKFLEIAPETPQTKEKEEGFDLKEALNPTEDLSEIMKAFDFYNPANDES